MVSPAWLVSGRLDMRLALLVVSCPATPWPETSQTGWSGVSVAWLRQSPLILHTRKIK